MSLLNKLDLWICWVRKVAVADFKSAEFFYFKVNTCSRMSKLLIFGKKIVCRLQCFFVFYIMSQGDVFIVKVIITSQWSSI